MVAKRKTTKKKSTKPNKINQANKITKVTEKTAKQPKKQISFVSITKKTWLELSAFWRPLVSVTAVYAILYFIFVMSFSLNNNVKELLGTTTGKLPQAFAVILDTTFNSYSGTQSDATTLIQMLLFLASTLAVLWSLRRLQNLQKVNVLEAFYEGPARIVPVIVVSLLLMLTFIPSLFGTTILGYVVASSASILEYVIAVGVSLLLIFSSLFLFVMYWPAFYIVTLPELRPLKAMNAARRVTKGYRLSILRKFVLLGILCFLLFLGVMLPIALLLPAIVPYVLYFVIFGIFLIVQVFLFELYRSLV